MGKTILIFYKFKFYYGEKLVHVSLYAHANLLESKTLRRGMVSWYPVPLTFLWLLPNCLQIDYPKSHTQDQLRKVSFTPDSILSVNFRCRLFSASTLWCVCGFLFLKKTRRTDYFSHFTCTNKAPLFRADSSNLYLGQAVVQFILSDQGHVYIFGKNETLSWGWDLTV